jgi:hypothetical protein
MQTPPLRLLGHSRYHPPLPPPQPADSTTDRTAAALVMGCFRATSINHWLWLSEGGPLQPKQLDTSSLHPCPSNSSVKAVWPYESCNPRTYVGQCLSHTPSCGLHLLRGGPGKAMPGHLRAHINKPWTHTSLQPHAAALAAACCPTHKHTACSCGNQGVAGPGSNAGSGWQQCLGSSGSSGGGWQQCIRPRWCIACSWCTRHAAEVCSLIEWTCAVVPLLLLPGACAGVTAAAAAVAVIIAACNLRHVWLTK